MEELPHQVRLVLIPLSTRFGLIDPRWVQGIFLSHQQYELSTSSPCNLGVLYLGSIFARITNLPYCCFIHQQQIQEVGYGRKEITIVVKIDIWRNNLYIYIQNPGIHGIPASVWSILIILLIHFTFQGFQVEKQVQLAKVHFYPSMMRGRSL